MKRLKVNEDIRPMSEFRTGIASFLKQVRTTKRPLIITQHGKGVAVLLDAGEYEADIGFSGGADIVTVLAAADDATIRGAVAAARKNRKRIMVDMINVNDLQERAREIDALGADYICVHTAFDLQVSGNNPLEDLKKVKKVSKKAGLAVAGGIKLETLAETVKERPEIIIVGGGITGRENRREIAAAMKKIMKG